MTAHRLPAMFTVTATPVGALRVGTEAQVFCVLPDAARVDHLACLLADARPPLFAADGTFADVDAAGRFDTLLSAVWPQRFWSAAQYGRAAYAAGSSLNPRQHAAFCRDFLGSMHRYDPVILQQLVSQFECGWHDAALHAPATSTRRSGPHPVSMHP